jgi:hypothetical protein
MLDLAFIISLLTSPILLVFFYKLIDCVFNTLKTVFLYKNEYFLSSACGTMSTIFYLVAIVQIAVSNNIYTFISIGLATFLGSYLPPLLIEKFEKDKLYIYEVTSDNLENGKNFADEIRELNIPIMTTKTYDKSMNKVLFCKIYSSSKTTSKIIQYSIPPTFKYNYYSPMN